MSTALALTSCEAQNIAAVGGQDAKSAAGTGEAVSAAGGFKKELEDCEAMVIPMQPTAESGSIPNAEAGMQNEPGGIQGFSGVCCAFEGLEMPEYPSDVAETQTQAMTQPMMPVDGMVQESLADGKQADSTSEQNAWMQNTTAGGTKSTPVITQDQILETVGAYIDAAAEVGPEKTGDQNQQAVTAQAAAPPTQEQNPAAVKTAVESMVADEAEAGSGMPGGECAEMKPVMPVAAEKSEITTADKSESAPVIKSEYTAVGKSKYETTGKTDSTEGINGKQDAPVKADGPEKSGKTQNIMTPGMNARETAPVAKDAGIQAIVQAEPEEAAQYTKENVLRIVDKVSTQASEGRYDFDVELKPEFLGKVSIKLSMEDGIIRMQIKTDDMSVKGMLTDQASSMQNALKEKGITLTSVDVTYESQASLDGGKQPFEQNDGGRRQGGMYYAQAEATDYEPMAEPYSYYVGNSSVEFLA